MLLKGVNWQTWASDAHLISQCSVELGKQFFNPPSNISSFLPFYFTLTLYTASNQGQGLFSLERKCRMLFFWKVWRTASLSQPNPDLNNAHRYLKKSVCIIFSYLTFQLQSVVSRVFLASYSVGSWAQVEILLPGDSLTHMLILWPSGNKLTHRLHCDITSLFILWEFGSNLSIQHI